MRRRRVVIPAIVAVLVVAAFLLWGPIGLGNGPLQVGQPGGEGWADSAAAPVALALPMSYAGRDSMVIDGVDFVGGTSYPAPHVAAAAELAAPRPGTCWALTEIAVHYHIGIRHFTATGPAGYAVCATANYKLVQTAMDAADGS
jgi:hypothetical protein